MKIKVDVARSVKISRTIKVRQLEGMFDVPAQERVEFSVRGDVDIPEPWSVGCIVGPSGSGKSTLLSEHFGLYEPPVWERESIVDDFVGDIKQVSQACSSVGFNTVPSWMKPFHVLSNGEKFRANIARLLAERDEIIIDEFTSVVDRQVAKTVSHCTQKYVRKCGKRIVVASCHYDILDWLRPDWVIEMPELSVTTRRSVRRPGINVTVGVCPIQAWKKFARFHYMTATVNKASRCYGLWIGDTLTTFMAVMCKPISIIKKATPRIFGVSRIVTLPDFQGMGLAFSLMNTVASAYTARGDRFRNYPAHPAFIRASDKSREWRLIGVSGIRRQTGNVSIKTRRRMNVVFEYVGPRSRRASKVLLNE